MTTLQNSMLKKGKKGFTLTELAIVIAVIAILIAVLVPTFSSVIIKARQTSALSNAQNTITEYTIEYQCYPDDGAVIDNGSDYYVVYDSTTDAVYTAVAKDKYADTYGSKDNYVAVDDAYLLFTGELAKVYGYDKNRTDVLGVTISGTTSITTSGTTALTATVIMTDKSTYSGTVTWSSSDTGVATVSAGTVTAVAAGTTTITATADNVSGSVTVTVTT